MSRKIPESHRRHIISKSAGLCNKCRKKLFVENNFGQIARLGDDAHIRAFSDYGARAESQLNIEERNSVKNLILLCKNCHSEMDQFTLDYDAGKIVSIREQHYKFVDEKLSEGSEINLNFNYIS